MNFKAIVLRPCSRGRGFEIAVDNLASTSLTTDEALGVVAAALYASKPPPYVKSLAEEERMQARYLDLPETYPEEERAAAAEGRRIEYDEEMEAHRWILRAARIAGFPKPASEPDEEPPARPTAECAHGLPLQEDCWQCNEDTRVPLEEPPPAPECKHDFVMPDHGTVAKCSKCGAEDDFSLPF